MCGETAEEPGSAHSKAVRRRVLLVWVLEDQAGTRASLVRRLGVDPLLRRGAHGGAQAVDDDAKETLKAFVGRTQYRILDL